MDEEKGLREEKYPFDTNTCTLFPCHLEQILVLWQYERELLFPVVVTMFLVEVVTLLGGEAVCFGSFLPAPIQRCVYLKKRGD